MNKTIKISLIIVGVLLLILVIIYFSVIFKPVKNELPLIPDIIEYKCCCKNNNCGGGCVGTGENTICPINNDYIDYKYGCNNCSVDN